MMDGAKIEAIRKYLSHNGVKYYDIQAELIDHFATAVETLQRENPGLTFKRALHIAHKEFGGDNGFYKFLERAERNVQKKTLLLVGRTLLKFLSWPYVLLTGIIYLAWWRVISSGWLGTDYLGYYLIFLGGFLIAFVINDIQLKRIHWYLPRQANRSLAFICWALFYIPAFALNKWGGGDVIMTTFFSFLSVFTLCLVMVPRVMNREVQQMYEVRWCP